VKNKYLFIIGFLSLALIASVFLVIRTTTTYQRAAGSSTSVVLENSYLFASPLQPKQIAKKKSESLSFYLMVGVWALPIKPSPSTYPKPSPSKTNRKS
jgi:hypothetical protein